jgi:hypothetical protein
MRQGIGEMASRRGLDISTITLARRFSAALLSELLLFQLGLGKVDFFEVALGIFVEVLKA